MFSGISTITCGEGTLVSIILIADDHKETRETLASLLSKQGHEVYTADSAFQLLELVRQHPDFQLVLTDLKMPRMDGIQLLETLRLQNRQAPIIVMSSFSTEDTVLAAFRHGATDYLQKPFTWKELQGVLRKAMQHVEKAHTQTPEPRN